MFNSLINDNLVEWVSKRPDTTISSFKKQDEQITKIENLFIKNVLDKINKQSSLAIRKYLDKIKKKDKDVLKEIDSDVGFNFNLNLIGELELLQKRGFQLGAEKGLGELVKQYSNDDSIAEFAKVYEGDLTDADGFLSNKSTKLPQVISKTNDNIDKVSTGETIESIRYYDVLEKIKTTENLNKYTNNLFYESKDFRNEYLQKRNINIAQNFTNRYKENIKKQIGDYIDKGKDITREKDLVEILTGQRIKLTKNPTQTQIKNRQTQGLTKEVITDESAYIDAVQGDLYKFSPNARVERIAKTELPVAYNLGSLNVFLEYGYDTFRIDNDDLVDNCVLCVSLQVRTKENPITLADLSSINYRPGSNNFYGIDFRNLDTKKKWNESPNSNQRIIAPVFHPNCYCRIIPVKKQSKKKLDEKNKTSKIGSVIKIANTISTAVTVHNAVVNTLDDIALQQKLKEEENKKNLYKALIAGTSILSMGTMYFYFYKNYLKSLDNNIAKEISYTILEEELSPIQKRETAIEIQQIINTIPTNILNKTQETLNALNAARPTKENNTISVINQINNVVPISNKSKQLSPQKINVEEILFEFNGLYKQIDQILKGDLSRLSKKVNEIEANRLTYSPNELDDLKNKTKNQLELLLAKADALYAKNETLFDILFLNTEIKKQRQLVLKFNKHRNTIDNSIRNKINKLFDKLKYTYGFSKKLYHIVNFKNKYKQGNE